LPRAFWISVYVGLPQTVVARIAVVTEWSCFPLKWVLELICSTVVK
jgi:hypothetical protein